MKWLVSLLFYSLMADLCLGQCRMANWWKSFDTQGWSQCDSNKEYMTGMERNDNRGDNDKINLLEEVKCCQAPAPNRDSASTCTKANWWGTLDSNSRWALCPAGHFLQGLYRTSGDWLSYIEEGKCCKPVGLPNAYGKCVDKDIGMSFDKKGVSSCDDGYYMTGFYKGGCNRLYCIEKIKCCKLFENPAQPAQECSNYQVIDDATRSRSYTTNSPTCDSGMSKKWYRFQGASGTRMASSCVSKNRCGTHAPGWLSGNHPTVAQGIQSVKVCFHWSSNCCQWSTNIRIRNCGGFFVYELKSPPVCRLRYCGNSGPGPSPPPECVNYQYLGNENRARGYEGSSSSATCDSSLTTKWYRLHDSSGGELPTSCVTKNRCGTHAPGWLSGNHPTVAQGIQSVKVCFHWSDNCCRWSTNIRARNCDGFYVYEFKSPPACHLRYCGNSDRNFCAKSPCKNGATCVNLQGNYRCSCKSGFSGVHCKIDVNECTNNPCKNGATCVNLHGSHRCDCKSGYTGSNCETDVNECANSPCKNGATCVNLQGSHRCDCKSGYTGSNCETDINECTNNPCKNGATCVNLQGSHRCDCKSGYTGSNCETDINECAPAPCKNGATCVDLVGRYRCDCAAGFTGNNCETNVNECAPAPCQNGATCVDLVGRYRCYCAAGYSGSNCETNINECAPAPCKNGATCVDLVGSYRCDCVTGYTGSKCETDINECVPAPCQNGATCADLVGSYRCDCATGFFGTNCEIAIDEDDDCLEGL